MKNKHPKLADVRETLSGKKLSAQQANTVSGGTFPWIDAPTP